MSRKSVMYNRQPLSVTTLNIHCFFLYPAHPLLREDCTFPAPRGNRTETQHRSQAFVHSRAQRQNLPLSRGERCRTGWCSVILALLFYFVELESSMNELLHYTGEKSVSCSCSECWITTWTNTRRPRGGFWTSPCLGLWPYPPRWDSSKTIHPVLPFSMCTDSAVPSGTLSMTCLLLSTTRDWLLFKQEAIR